jgi:arylsulfatase
MSGSARRAHSRFPKATTRCGWSHVRRWGSRQGGTAALYIDGVAVGEGRIEQTEAFLFSADETCEVGDEVGSPVTTDYSVKRFTREVNWVELDLGLDDHNHVIKPEDRLRVAVAIQ